MQTINLPPNSDPSQTNLINLGRLSLRVLPWLGFLAALVFILLGKAPHDVQALDQGEQPLVPNLSLTLNDNPDPVKLGATLLYTITATNDGTAPATNVVLTNELDPNVTFEAASGGGVFAAPLVTWQLGNLLPGQTVTQTVSVTVNKKPEGKILIVNTAKVYSDEGAADCDTITTTIITPDLKLDKSDEPDPVILNEMLTYTIVVSNVGYAEATNVVITDTLDSHVTFESASDGGMHDPATRIVTWDIGTITPWETITRTLTVLVSQMPHEHILWNTACVTSLEEANDCDDEHTELHLPELRIEKFDSADPVGPGQTLTYTIKVSNIGEIRAQNVIITDDLDSTVTFVAADNGGVHNGTTPNGMVTWPVISILQPGETVTRTITTTVDEQATCGTEFPNMAETTSIEWVHETTTITTAISGGQVTVNACEDKNADGVCDEQEKLANLPGIQAQLTGNGLTTPYQAVPATFRVDPGTYTATLRFTGESQGLYPTLPMSVTVAQCDEVTIPLPFVDPIHPKGVAVHEGSNKVYVVFQGKNGEDGYEPFVAVIDSETDQVIHTIPGGAGGQAPTGVRAPLGLGIGRASWGIAISGDYGYVGSFDDRLVSIIDVASDTVIGHITEAEVNAVNHGPNSPEDRMFRPAEPFVNPTNGQVHFPDYYGQRVVILDGLTISDVLTVADRRNSDPGVFSPFEIAIANEGSGYSFLSLRDAINTLSEIRGFSTPPPLTEHDILLPNQPTDKPSGSPHAVALWENHPDTPHLFVTYAIDPAVNGGQPFRNPSQLLTYQYKAGDPTNLSGPTVTDLSSEGINYAEVGLIYNPVLNTMLGAYSDFPYWDDKNFSNWETCMDSKDAIRGGTYTIDSSNSVAKGPTPQRVVGNTPITVDGLDWKNPFEMAHNPNNDKVYVTDRCWNDWADHGGASKIAHGAVLVIKDGLSEATATNADVSPQAPTPTSDPVGPTEVFPVADVNRDGVVNIVDLSYIANHYGSNDPAADLNGDGIVDVVDMGIAALGYQ